jgi:transposase
LLLEDNATAHKAKLTKQWHTNRGIKLLEGWPVNSPNLNPIENLWGLMKSQLFKERRMSNEDYLK